MRALRFLYKIRNRYKNAPIKWKILVINIAIIGIPLIAFAFFANMISTHAIIDKAQKYSEKDLALVNKSISIFINDAEDYARILSTDFRLQQNMYQRSKQEFSSLQKQELRNTL